MAENIEIKARCLDFIATQRRVQKLASGYLGSDFQTDTYFQVKNGRLKLRESRLDGAYLIPYIRPDKSGPKNSLYTKIKIDNPDEVKNLFHNMFGIHVVVCKKRDIYTIENVRIHLDKVDHLGTFIELEALLKPPHSDPRHEKKRVNELMETLHINKNDLIAESYESLLKMQDKTFT